MAFLSSGVAGRSAGPTTNSRTVPWPTSRAWLTAKRLSLQPGEVGGHVSPIGVDPVFLPALPVLLFEHSPQGRGRGPAVARDLGGDALACAALGSGVAQDGAVGMAVHVHEARADVEAAHVHRPRRLGRGRPRRRPRSCRPSPRRRPQTRAAPVPSSTVPPERTRSKAGAASSRPGRHAPRNTAPAPDSRRKRRRVLSPIFVTFLPPFPLARPRPGPYPPAMSVTVSDHRRPGALVLELRRPPVNVLDFERDRRDRRSPRGPPHAP